MKICIDGGHGLNMNKGLNGYYEGNKMFVLMNMTAEELAKYDGVEIVTTRKTVRDNPSLTARGKMAANMDLMLSLHSNAIGISGTEKTRGASIFDSLVKPNRELADKLVTKVAQTMNTPNRGVMTRKGTWGFYDYYTVMKSAIDNKCKSAMLIEQGFHTNGQDSLWLLMDSNLRQLAIGHAQIIAKHYGLVKPMPQPAIPSGQSYTVKNGDTLWGIAQEVYGDGMRYKEIVALNNLVNPDMLFTGQVLKLSEGEGKVEVPDVKPEQGRYMVQVTASALNIRSGAGTSYKIVGTIRDKGAYTIIETSGKWGKLLSGAGWIYLDYTKKI